MANRSDNWVLTGPPEALDEAIHIRVRCFSCGNAFGEYLLAARPGALLPVGHERNELPSEPGWIRVGPRPSSVRGPLTGALAYKIEVFEGRTYLRWRCRGRYAGRCRASPKIGWRALVKRVRRLATQTPERPIEIRL